MSDIVWIKKINDVHLYVYCEPSVAKELSTYFTFEVPGAKFMPTVRNRMWDGKIRLFSKQTGQIYVGLLPYLKQFCEKNEIEYSIKEGEAMRWIDNDDAKGFIDSLKPKKEFIERVPLKRVGRVKEISSVISLLASKDG